MNVFERIMQDARDSACRECAGLGKLHSHFVFHYEGGRTAGVDEDRDCTVCEGSGVAPFKAMPR